VLLVSRTAEEVAALAEEIEAEGGVARAHPADVTDEAAVAECVAAAGELGDLRVCVTAAGTNRPAPAHDYPIADWDRLFDINVRATFLACQAVGASLLKRGVGGAIVTLSSTMGTTGYPERVAYCATKHAVEGMTKALGVEWAPHRIRVNAVAPTFVRTPMTAARLDDPDFHAEVLRRIPAGELATVQQVADATRYLACDASGSVTGTVLRVDGGWTAW
jgi:NAD(P)-dependent dehydrogenase (short-subunit alcohol dehydrogenase family)